MQTCLCGHLSGGAKPGEIRQHVNIVVYDHCVETKSRNIECTVTFSTRESHLS